MAEKRKQYVYKAAAIVFWLGLWQVLSLCIRQEIVFASPGATLKALVRLAGDDGFWSAAGHSFVRIISGFLLACVSGILAAWLSYECRLVRELLEPAMKVIKATPIASFVILALIWVSSKNLAVLIAFLIVLPVTYTNVLKGLSETDSQLLEMARVFRMPYGRKLRYIYGPAVRPYLLSAVSLGLGMCWKAGIAAEVIGLPARSIGRELYDAKLYLMTPELFAWTIVIIVLSAGFEKLVMAVLRRVMKGDGR